MSESLNKENRHKVVGIMTGHNTQELQCVSGNFYAFQMQLPGIKNCLGQGQRASRSKNAITSSLNSFLV